MEEEIQLIVLRRDVGRILSGLRERRRKLEKGILRFGDKFDPEKGKNMTEGLAAYNTLITFIEEQTNNA